MNDSDSMENPDSASPISVIVVDDHPMMREGICNVLKSDGAFHILADVGTAREGIEAYRQFRPDVLLMDLQLPDMSGIEALTEIRREFNDARVIIFTTYSRDIKALQAIKAGASSYMLKSMLRRELLDTVRKVHMGIRHIPNEIAVEMAAHYGEDALSERELEVLRLVAQGMSNKRLAQVLHISEDTVKSHMKAVLSKLNATDRTHAVIIALQRGFVDL